MTSLRPDASVRYDKMSIALHWIVALTVAFQWLGAHAIDWFPRGPLRVDARSVHIVTGVLLTGVILFRLYWRLGGGQRFKTAGTLSGVSAAVVHFGLYACLLAVLGLGVFNTWLRGDQLFGLVHIPKFGTYTDIARHQFVEQVVGLHSLIANIILLLAGLHASAALGHFLILKDNVLQRMLPFLRVNRDL